MEDNNQRDFMYEQKMKRIQEMLVSEFDAEAFILMFKSSKRDSLDAVNYISNGSQIIMLFELYVKLGGRIDEFVSSLIQQMNQQKLNSGVEEPKGILSDAKES